MKFRQTPLVLVVGTDSVVLEGIVQTLTSSGFRVACAASNDEASLATAEERPLILLVASELTITHPQLLLLPRRAGGAALLWYTTPGEEPQLSAEVRRQVLAELLLPLERKRLVALARIVVDRAVESGRNGDDDTSLEDSHRRR